MGTSIVLLSGGMDSMACVHACRRKGGGLRGLFIDYGQAAAGREEAAARRIAAHFRIGLEVTRVSGPAALVSNGGFVMGRNMAFVLLALMSAPPDAEAIVLGIHAGTGYSDCSPEFLALAQQVCDLYTGGRVRVEAPFLHSNKAKIAIYCLLNSLPRELSYSCELGLDQPCGRCKSCKDLIVLDGPAPAGS